ncbi:hypothetical protein Btru_049735 [Bulinus truncatus]|nr:hypothetical protein Btru_049735 [Bulinus truncatus]
MTRILEVFQLFQVLNVAADKSVLTAGTSPNAQENNKEEKVSPSASRVSRGKMRLTDYAAAVKIITYSREKAACCNNNTRPSVHGGKQPRRLCEKDRRFGRMRRKEEEEEEIFTDSTHDFRYPRPSSVTLFVNVWRSHASPIPLKTSPHCPAASNGAPTHPVVTCT